MKSMFKLTSGETTNKTDYYFEDGTHLTLEINDVERKELETPFGYLIKVVEFAKELYIGEVHFMRISDIEETYDIDLGIECITYA